MRRALIAVITLLLAMFTFTLLFGSWMRHSVVDRDAFVASATDSFTREGSYEAIGVTVAERVADEYAVFGILGDDLAPIFADLFATEPFAPMLEGVVIDIHARLIDGDRGPVLVDLSSYEDVILATLSAISPGLIDLLPASFFRSYVLFEAGAVPDIALQADAIAAASWVALPALGILVLMLVLVARSATTVTVSLGIALVLAALAGLAFIPWGWVTLDITIQDPEYLILARNMFDVMTGALVHRAVAVGIAGATVLLLGVVGFVRRRPPPSTDTR